MKKPKDQINNCINWSEMYDFYQTEIREQYKKFPIDQNDSHFALIKYFIRRKLIKSESFAEFGFGAGLTLRLASKYFRRVVGLDISLKNVEVTNSELRQEGFNRIELYFSDILKKEARFESQFDVISFIHGLEHFSENDFTRILNTVKYYLKPGGIFTGALPHDSEFNYRMCPQCGHVFEIDGHLSRYTCKSLSELFSKNNFEILYLSDFNVYYYRERKGLIKFLYRYLVNVLLNRKIKGSQIEYLVKPMN